MRSFNIYFMRRWRLSMSRVSTAPLQWWSMITPMIIFIAISSCVNGSATYAEAPRHRIDLATAYTVVDVGDWQTINGSYTYQWAHLTTGLATRVLRREFPTEAPIDFSLLLPLYTAYKALSLEMWGEWSPSPTLVPQYSLQLSPSLRISSLFSALHFTYRYAEYTQASAQVLTPGFSWRHPRLGWAAGAYLYITIPEFGETLYTPQVRLERMFSYFWRFELWCTYGYETLNDRFVDPTRQAPQLSLYAQLKHLFDDYTGLNLGLAWVNFLPPNPQIAQERFNRDRLEVSLRTFFRF